MSLCQSLKVSWSSVTTVSTLFTLLPTFELLFHIFFFFHLSFSQAIGGMPKSSDREVRYKQRCIPACSAVLEVDELERPMEARDSSGDRREQGLEESTSVPVTPHPKLTSPDWRISVSHAFSFLYLFHLHYSSGMLKQICGTTSCAFIIGSINNRWVTC